MVSQPHPLTALDERLRQSPTGLLVFPPLVNSNMALVGHAQGVILSNPSVWHCLEPRAIRGPPKGGAGTLTLPSTKTPVLAGKWPPTPQPSSMAARLPSPVWKEKPVTRASAQSSLPAGCCSACRIWLRWGLDPQKCKPSHHLGVSQSRRCLVGWFQREKQQGTTPNFSGPIPVWGNTCLVLPRGL